MKKTLIALAAVAATSAAFAQSTVTLSGVAAFGYQKDVTPTTGTVGKGLAATDATFRLGMVEDLGGGLKASGNMEFDTASAQFGNALNRRTASLTLSGGFGSVALINTRSGDLLTRGMVAPSYLPDGMYDSSGVIARVPVDVLSYTAPAFSGFTPYVQYVEHTADGTDTPTRRVYVLGGNFASGPLAAGVALKSTRAADGTVLAAGTKKNNLELFATYDLGVARLGVGFDSKRTDTDKNAFSFGVAAPLGPVTVGVNYAKRDANKVTELAAQYDLSKRTNVNLSVGKQTFDNNGNQYRLAIRHNF